MAKANRDNAQLELMRDITDDITESDFVPYACLADPYTLLTKNGEVMQVIKVTGFSYEGIHQDQTDLREVIRQAVSQSIKSEDYALWFHTLRRKRSLVKDTHFPDRFSSSLNHKWNARNAWDKKYVNELYVSIVRVGQSAAIGNVQNFINGLLPNRDGRARNRYIDESVTALNETVQLMMQHLEAFGAKRLGTVKRDGVYYGEHIEFLEKLINLAERPMPVEEVDLSEHLTGGEITFAYNAMEVRTVADERRFGAILTIKEYKEASLGKIDEFLQLPCEFIVTQCIDFVNAKEALRSYEAQTYYLRLSGDKELAEKSELSTILQQNRQLPTDYGEHQTSVFVIAPSTKELESNVKRIRAMMSHHGLVTIREDLKFEECYWAQLPANFEFVKRLSYTNSGHMAGFVNIQNFPAGNATGSKWGAPVSVFYTAAGTPYFFNFHIDDIGHTSVVGPRGSGKSVLINFLISQAQQYNARLYYFDADGHARHFIHAMDGAYTDMCDRASGAKMSPLSLPDSKANREFLAMWVGTLMDATGASINATTLEFLRNVIADYYADTTAGKGLATIARHVATQDPMMAQMLAPWHGNGEFAHLFDHQEDTLISDNNKIGFNLSPIMNQPAQLVPVASYMMHHITMQCGNAEPTIIVLDEAWALLNTPLFAPRVKEWLNYLTSKNVVLISATENVEELENYGFAADVAQASASQIFLPNDDPSDVYRDVFGLDAQEYGYIDAMNPEFRHFLLKRGQETIVAELNLQGFDDELEVLSGTQPTRSAMPVSQAEATPASAAAPLWDEGATG